MAPGVHCASPTVFVNFTYMFRTQWVQTCSRYSYKHHSLRVGGGQQGTRQTTLSPFLQLSLRAGRHARKQLHTTEYRRRTGKRGSKLTPAHRAVGGEEAEAQCWKKLPVSPQGGDKARRWTHGKTPGRLRCHEPFLHGAQLLQGEPRVCK